MLFWFVHLTDLQLQQFSIECFNVVGYIDTQKMMRCATRTHLSFSAAAMISRKPFSDGMFETVGMRCEHLP